MRFLLAAVLGCVLLPMTAPAASIRDCGDMRSYKPAPYLAMAAGLQSLKKEAAIGILRQWAFSGNYNDQVIILCRMLFEPKQGAEFHRPALGGPQFYGGTTFKDWPLEPITVVDGVPFLVVIGYMVAGEPEGATAYLDYCVANAEWTSRRYTVVGRQEIETAFAKLLKSPKWKQPLDKWQLDCLTKQME